MTSSTANDTRERILAAAATVLSRKGYAGARLSDIAELAELRTPAVYYYFESREHLVNEVMSVGQRSVLEHVLAALEALPPDADALEKLNSAVRAHLEVELTLSDFATAVTRNAGQLPPDLQETFKADSRRYFAMWDGILGDLAADGVLDLDLDVRVARMLVLGALNWTAEWWDIRHGELDDVIETAQIFVRGSLLKRPCDDLYSNID